MRNLFYSVAAVFFTMLVFASCEEYTLPQEGDFMNEYAEPEEEAEDDGAFVSIKFNIPAGEYSITRGNKIALSATVKGDIVREPEYTWSLNGTELAQGLNLLFEGTTAGVQYILFKVRAENGEAEKEFILTVQEPPDTNTLFYFDYGKWRNAHTPAVQTYRVPKGRRLIITPVRHYRQLMDTTKYEWALDGVIQRQDILFPCYFEFTASGNVGEIHTVTVYARDRNRYGTFQAAAETKIQIIESEGTFKRAVSSSSNAVADRVYEFTPAPGQFIREDGAGYPPVAFVPGITEQDVVNETQAYILRFNTEWCISLGSWGGYLVTGFDHSIENIPGAYSFSIEGNPLDQWHEPGIVWVSQDENGNGEADDTWFELRSSETGKESTVQLYSVTFQKPDPVAGLVWEDNIGEHGALPNKTFYGLPFGFPYQTGGDSVTFTGTLLPSHIFITGGNIPPNLITAYAFPYGYVDNGGRVTHFKISDAMQIDGTPANLKYIDFVKVQTAVFGLAGILGEMSTEMGLPVDYQMSR
jgi:hypothetical protein